MDDKTRKILERPFDQALVKQRVGPGGQTLTYVPVQTYIDRLNEAFSGDWSFETTHREQHEDEVIVEGRLTTGQAIKTGVGGAMVTRRRDTGKLVSLADDYKKAEADALKRACRLLGVGASLQHGETAMLDDDNGLAEEPVVERDPRHPEPPPRLQAASPSPVPVRPPLETHASPTRSRLTSKQLAAIWAIATRIGYGQREFRNYTRETYGVQPEFLTRDAASRIIGELGNTPSANNNGNGREHVLRNPGEEG